MTDDDVAPIRIVIAEDEAIIRLDLRESLEAEGYIVVGETGRGDEAVELSRALKPDVVILDIKMPGLTGIEAAEIINKENIAAVLLLTAFSQRDLIQDASQAGALAYLVKPFQRSELVPSIELAIGRFQEIIALKKENDDLLENLETRKVVDRAKGALMDQYGLKEKDAYRYLQKKAMEKRSPMKEVAKSILEGDNGSLHKSISGE
ncbi:MAG: response regulator [Actinomycetota bacterium]|nr:response regulator [Actinomycetota bacterium]